MRQTTEIISKLSAGMNITVAYGEGSNLISPQILVATPNYFKNKLQGRKDVLNLKSVNMVVFDEADEVFNQEANHAVLTLLIE